MSDTNPHDADKLDDGAGSPAREVFATLTYVLLSVQGLFAMVIAGCGSMWSAAIPPVALGCVFFGVMLMVFTVRAWLTVGTPECGVWLFFGLLLFAPAAWFLVMILSSVFG